MPEIRIDTSELTYSWFWLPGHLPHFVDGSVPGGAVVHLTPGDYAFQQTRYRATDLRFHVTDEGTVDFHPRHDDQLEGRGTGTLRVRGVPVTLRPTGTPRPVLPMWGGCHEPLDTSARTLRMPTGPAYAIRLGSVPSTVVEFSVAADGRVDYRSEYDRALSGRGTGCLTLDLDRVGRH